MAKHKLHDCGFETCFICKGGLAFCEVCKGGEGDLPTECPGRMMTEEQIDGVSRQQIDFVNGMWRELPVRKESRSNE